MNIIDYIKWRGDIKFFVDPFNFVDNLILTKLVYIDFDGIVTDKKITIEQANKLYREKNPDLKDNKLFFSHPLSNLLDLLAHSPRFHNAKLYNYKSIISEEKVEQFAAICIDLPDGSTYISYRGTDDTIVGWKENFVSLYQETSGQIDALKYFEENASSFFKKIRLGGHSKGGNLALYSACKCNEKLRKKIIAIYNNDGPGLCPIVFNEDEYELIKDRYYKIVPRMDVFGLVFDHGQTRYIVETKKDDVFSHDGFTWNVERNDFIYADSLRKEASTLGQAFEQFILDTTLEQRQYFTQELFKTFDDNNIKNLNELENNGINNIIIALKALSELDEDARKVSIKFIRVFTSIFGVKVNELLEKIDPRKKAS